MWSRGLFQYKKGRCLGLVIHRSVYLSSLWGGGQMHHGTNASQQGTKLDKVIFEL
jgi:hypothetical protein